MNCMNIMNKGIMSRLLLRLLLGANEKLLTQHILDLSPNINCCKLATRVGLGLVLGLTAKC